MYSLTDLKFASDIFRITQPDATVLILPIWAIYPLPILLNPSPPVFSHPHIFAAQPTNIINIGHFNGPDNRLKISKYQMIDNACFSTRWYFQFRWCIIINLKDVVCHYSWYLSFWFHNPIQEIYVNSVKEALQIKFPDIRFVYSFKYISPCSV